MAKRKSKKKKKYRIIILLSVVLISAVCYLLYPHLRFRYLINDSELIVPPPIALNDTLSNSMSDIEGFERFDRKVWEWIRYWDIKGVSLAVMKNDSLLYAKGYGWANVEDSIPMEPYHLLRIASVSKLITATGIMKLCEEHKLSLDTLVFGPDGVLNDSIYLNIQDKRYYKITVEHLLRHQGGFTLSRGDPMFTTSDIMKWEKMDTPPDRKQFIEYLLSRRLGYTPGSRHKYSNVGYMFLSLVIEKVTGKPYEDYMRDEVLIPAGCYDMYLGNTYYEDRMVNEARYYMNKDAVPVEDFHLNGKMVDKCYGGSDFEKLLGAGGWITSAPELARFIASIDGRDEVPDIISAESVRKMTEYSESFPLGWADITKNGEWYRSGTLSGTSVLIKYFPDGYCWILITNSSTWRGSLFSRDISTLFRRLSALVSKWPERDLFSLQPA